MTAPQGKPKKTPMPSALAKAAAKGMKRHAAKRKERLNMSLANVRMAFAKGGAVPRIREGTHEAIVNLAQDIFSRITKECILLAQADGCKTVTSSHAKMATQHVLRNRSI